MQGKPRISSYFKLCKINFNNQLDIFQTSYICPPYNYHYKEFAKKTPL